MSKDIRAFIPFTNVDGTNDNRLPMLYIPAKNLSPVSVTNFPVSKWKRRQLAITYKGKISNRPITMVDNESLATIQFSFETVGEQNVYHISASKNTVQ